MILFGALFVLSLLNSVGAVLLAVEFRRVSSLYEQMYNMLLSERDAAREESKTLKAALFPQLRVVGASTPTGQRTPPHPTAAAAPTLFPPRIPWRVRFKTLVRQHNTQQLGRDRMAQAIQEKPNA